MRIAVTYENGNIFQHFGHTEQLKIYDIEDKKIIKAEIVNTNGQGHGALSEFLINNKIDILICGGIGEGAKTAINEGGVKLFGGVNGKADDAVNAYLNRTLVYNDDAHCEHHKHEEGHKCGEHSCNEDKHGCSGN